MRRSKYSTLVPIFAGEMLHDIITEFRFGAWPSFIDVCAATSI